jgi:transketolase
MESKPIAIRDEFGRALVRAGEEHPSVVVISCDLKGATKTRAFFDAFPTRSFEVGIAEANGIGISAGLALAGFRPFISSFASFITGKNVEIRSSIAYNNAPVVVVGTHGGLIGPDGATQAGLQDVTTMRAMPNFIILQPASPIETAAMVSYLAVSREPAYLRIARNEAPELYNQSYRFQLGRGQVLRDGSDMTIISSGPPVHSALKAASMLAEHVSIRVVNMPTLKPIDKELIIRCARETRGIMTVMDHSVEGGLGSMVAEVVAEHGLHTPVYRHGIRDVFTESGTPAELERKYELDGDGLATHLFRFMRNINFNLLRNLELVNANQQGHENLHLGRRAAR